MTHLFRGRVRLQYKIEREALLQYERGPGYNDNSDESVSLHEDVIVLDPNGVIQDYFNVTD